MHQVTVIPWTEFEQLRDSIYNTICDLAIYTELDIESLSYISRSYTPDMALYRRAYNAAIRKLHNQGSEVAQYYF